MEGLSHFQCTAVSQHTMAGETRERETNTLSNEPLYVLKATIQPATTEFLTKEKTQMLDQGHMHRNFIRPLASKGPGTGSTPSLTAR